MRYEWGTQIHKSTWKAQQRAAIAILKADFVDKATMEGFVVLDEPRVFHTSTSFNSASVVVDMYAEVEHRKQASLL